MADRQEQQGASAAPQTTTQTMTLPEQQAQTTTLRLRGAPPANERSVQWADDVVDNESLGRKSSKVCCIYHRPKAVDESSDESSSSDSSDSEADAGHGKGDGDGDGKAPACSHAHHGRGRRRTQKPDDKRGRPPSPNAYEKVPKPKAANKAAPSGS